MTNLIAAAKTASNNNSIDPSTEDPIRLGETKEIGALRIHRYRNCVKVLDTTNAGKRGKKCLEISVGKYDNSWNDIDGGIAGEVYWWATRGASIEEMASILDECHTVGRNEYRGVDIDPIGAAIEFVSDRLVGKFTATEFSVRDLVDPNEETMMNTEGKASAKLALKWATANRDRLESLTLHQMRTAMREAGIKIHSYCGMD